MSYAFLYHSNWLYVSKYEPLQMMLLSCIQRYLIFISQDVYNIEEIAWVSFLS